MSGRRCASCARALTERRARRGGWVSIVDRTQGAHYLYCHECSGDALGELDGAPDGPEVAYVILTDPLRLAELHPVPTSSLAPRRIVL